MRKLLIILAVCSLATGAHAANDDLNGGAERHLGGHGFLPSIYVTDPWITTSFQNYTGGGVAIGLETPFIDVDGTQLFTLEGDLLYASLGLAFQQRLGGRMAVGARFGALVRSGTNAQTLIADGANVDRSLNLWFKYRLRRTETTQLTVGVDWDYAKTFIITPYEFAQGIVNGEDLDEAGLLFNVKNWTARLTLEYAHAFNPTFGLRANAAIGLYEEPLADGISKATHRFGLLGEMDLAPNRDIPLGFTLGYTKGFPANDPAAGLAGTLLGIWYTGREAFTVGVETGYMTLPVRNQDKDIDAVFGVFTVRYYF